MQVRQADSEAILVARVFNPCGAILKLNESFYGGRRLHGLKTRATIKSRDTSFALV